MSEYMNGASDPLLEPVFLKADMACRNRIAMAAMTHYSAPEDGSVGDAELAYIERRSSGPGVVFTACVATSPDGKAYDGEPAAHDDRFLTGPDPVGGYHQARRCQGHSAVASWRRRLPASSGAARRCRLPQRRSHART